MSRRFQRWVYCAILRLHPASFRDRFSGEMLWIFEQTVGEVGMLRLVLDGLSSVLKQQLAEDAVPQFVAGPFQALPTNYLSFLRLTQATALAVVVMFGFFALLEQSVPLPQEPRTFALRRAVFDFCGEYKMVPRDRLQ